MYKVLLIDRCHFSRQGLCHWLCYPQRFMLEFDIRETDKLLEARKDILHWQPNMVIADLFGFTPDIHDIRLFSAIFSACGPSTRLILLHSGYLQELEDYCEYYHPWILEYKTLPLSELRHVINLAMISRPPFGTGHHEQPLLTLKEEQILDLWRKEISNESIAKIMKISPKTVYTYKRNIRMKLGAGNRVVLFKTHNKELHTEEESLN